MSNGKGSRARNNHSEAFRANFDHIFRKKDDLKDFEAILGPRKDPREPLKEWVTRTYDDDKKTWPKGKRPKIPAYTVVFKQMPNQAPTNPSKRAKSHGNGPSEASGRQGKGRK